jgi:metallo-beta-lactamase family protein
MVTGSCIHVQTGTTQLLIDCGTSQESGANNHSPPQFPFKPQQIDAIILTHGHLDHTGRIPELVRAGFKGAIYGHYATIDIAQIIWNDALHHESETALTFDEFDVKTAIARCIPVAYSVPMQIMDVTFQLKDAGHILGSSHILLEHKEKSVLFSGDIGSEKTPIIRDPFTNWEKSVNAVVIESTYGSRVHKNRTKTIAEFEQIVARTIARRGVLLIPSFAVGRTQEILYHLNTVIEEKRTKPLPVFVDSPMSSKVTSIYRRHRDCYDKEAFEKLVSGDNPLAFGGLSFVDSVEQSRMLRSMRPPFIIIAGSGMCNGGRILGHLEHFISESNTTVMFVGWQSQGSPGRTLVDGTQQITINGKTLPVRARIETLNGFSAHADRNGLLSWAHAIPGVDKKWFVNHGEPLQTCSLAETISRELGGCAVAVERGVVYEV